MASPKEPELKFKPLSSGLGFHPFSEGLPYADQNKKLPTRPLPARPNFASPSQPKISEKPVAPEARRNSGTGASAAGRPHFMPPTSLTPNTKRNLNETFGIALPPKTAPAPIAKSLATPSAHLERIGGSAYDLMYCFKRALAYGLDTALNSIVCGLALFVTFWKQEIGFKILSDPGVLLGVGLFLVLFNWALITAQEVLFGTTAGKKIFGLALFGTPSTIMVRSLFFLMGLALGGLGVVWALFHPAKRGWHDMVADIQPEEIAIL